MTTDLREITEADVYVDDSVVARLRRIAGDDIAFDYTAPANANGRPVRERSVAWSLPITDDYPRITTGGSVPPFFAGLLPEGVRLGVVLSSTKTSPDDHLTLLLAIGADTTGNVRVVPAGTPHRYVCRCLCPTATKTFVPSSNASPVRWTPTREDWRAFSQR